MHSWWKTQDFSKIESGPNYTTVAHAFVKPTLRLGLRAPFVARNNYPDRAEYHLILSRRGRTIFRKIEQDNCFINQQIDNKARNIF